VLAWDSSDLIFCRAHPAEAAEQASHLLAGFSMDLKNRNTELSAAEAMMNPTIIY